MLFRRSNEQIDQEIAEIKEENKNLASDVADIKFNQKQRSRNKTEKEN